MVIFVIQVEDSGGLGHFADYEGRMSATLRCFGCLLTMVFLPRSFPLICASSVGSELADPIDES